MDLYKFAWLLWIGGTILIVLSWDGTVSAEIGWAGFIMALIGTALSFIPHLRGKRSASVPNGGTDGTTVNSDAEPKATVDRASDERFSSVSRYPLGWLLNLVVGKLLSREEYWHSDALADSLGGRKKKRSGGMFRRRKKGSGVRLRQKGSEQAASADRAGIKAFRGISSLQPALLLF